MPQFNTKRLNQLIAILCIIAVIFLIRITNLLPVITSLLLSLVPFYVAFFIAWMMRPLGTFFNEKLKINIHFANFLAIFLNLLVLAIFLFVIIPLAIIQMFSLVSTTPQIVEGIQSNISSFGLSIKVNTPAVFEQIRATLVQVTFEDFLNYLDLFASSVGYLIGTVFGVISFFGQIFFAYIIAFYFINDITSFSKRGINLVFKTRAKAYSQTALEISKVLFGYFRGLLIVCLFTGSLVAFGCWVIGMPSPILFGIIAGSLNVIPFLGPVLGGIPIALVALSISFKELCLAMIVVFGTQFIESNFLQPKVMSKQTKLHPVTILVGLLVFRALLGFPGMIISTPVLAAVNVVLKKSKYDIHL